jgi:hypothetical protein
MATAPQYKDAMVQGLLEVAPDAIVGIDTEGVVILVTGRPSTSRLSARRAGRDAAPDVWRGRCPLIAEPVAESLKERVRVVVGDDHALIREAIRRRLQATPDIELVGEGTSGEEILGLLADADVPIEGA